MLKFKYMLSLSYRVKFGLDKQMFFFLFFLTPPFLPCEGHQPHLRLVTLLPGSVGLRLHMLGSPEPNSGWRS